MADDPYRVLGVARTATADEIRKAYRALAKQTHPDLHPGDAAAEARFKAVNAANDLLGDIEKRGRFDRGEIDAEGQPTAPPGPPPRSSPRNGQGGRPEERAFYRDFAQAGAGGERYGFGAGTGGIDPDQLEEMLGMFGRGRAGTRAGPQRGRDRSFRLDVPFLDAVNGATERLGLPDGASLDVRIPPGLSDGQILRLRGKGEKGIDGGEDGDALIEVSVLRHALYRRDGVDLEMDVPVTFREAVLGGRVEVPTPRGRVMLAVAARSETGARLRLRGRGIAVHRGPDGAEVAAGDLYAVLRVVVGAVDADLETFLAGWTGPAQDVRANLASSAGEPGT